MIFGRSKEFPGSVEGTIKFDQETCCALGRGFEKNPEVAKELEEIVGADRIKAFVEILPRTEKMKFVPSEEMKMIYGQIAKRELERIEAEDEDDEDLSCGHTVNEHREALEGVIGKMKTTIN